MAAGAKGRASMRRVGALQSGEPETAPTRRQVAAATGDDARARAYRQGQAAAGRALDERPRLRPTRGPARVHDDDELQGIYEQGHHDRVRAARRDALRQRVAPAAAPARKVTDNGAGFVLGLLAFAALRNYLTGGWSGVGRWLAAKFVNKTPSSGAPLGFNSPGATPGKAAPPGSKNISPSTGGVDPYQGLPGGVGGLGSFG